MKYQELMNHLKKQLDLKYQKSFDYPAKIAEKLGLEVRAVKRKLSGETKFSATEIFDIAREFSLSLDHIGKRYGRLPMELHNYDFSKEHFWEIINNNIKTYEYVCQSGESHFMYAGNMLPISLWGDKKATAGYMYLLWYYNRNADSTPLTQITPEQQKRYNKAMMRYLTAKKNMHLSTYIFPQYLIRDLCDTILYFYHSRLLTTEEVTAIREELLQILEYLEITSRQGMFPETGKKVRIYISHKPIAIDLNIIESTNMNLAMIYVLHLYSILSLSPETYETLQGWFNAILRSSVLISESNEIERKRYFARQKEELNRLTGLA